MANFVPRVPMVNPVRWILTVATAILMFSGPALSAGYAGYVVTDLGPTSGNDPQVTGLNNHGQLIRNDLGNAGIAGGIIGSDAWSYSNGTWTELTTVGGSFIEAFGVNDSGQIVGSFAKGSCMQFYCVGAFLYSGGTMIDLGTMIDTDLGTTGGSTSSANAINASGQVVGTYQTLSAIGIQYNFAWLYANGTLTELGTLGGPSSVAYGINAAGTIVGASETSSGDYHAFRLCQCDVRHLPS